MYFLPFVAEDFVVCDPAVWSTRRSPASTCDKVTNGSTRGPFVHMRAEHQRGWTAVGVR